MAAASPECLVSLSSSWMVSWHCLQLQSWASCDLSLEFSLYAVLGSLEVFSGMIWFWMEFLWRAFLQQT